MKLYEINLLEARIEPPAKWDHSPAQSLIDDGDATMSHLEDVAERLEYLDYDAADIRATMRDYQRSASASALWWAADIAERYGYEKEAEAARQIADYIERKSLK